MKKKILIIIGCIFLWISLALGLMMCGFIYLFGSMSMDRLLFHLSTSQAGTPITTFIIMGLALIVLPTLVMLLVLFWPNILKKLFKVERLWFNKARLLGAVFIGVFSLIFVELSLHPISYIFAQNIESQFFVEHYVNPKEAQIVAPKHKKNLIWIWMESLESSFMDIDNGGNNRENVIEPLTILAKDHTNFSWNDKYGGFFPVNTATHTIGGQVAQMGGIPFFSQIGSSSSGSIRPGQEIEDRPIKPFMAGMYNLGDILLDNGYKNVFVSGADSRFGDQNQLFLQHGNFEIIDYEWLLKNNRIPQDYFVFWGVEDDKVFLNAKEKILDLAKSDQPFQIHIETMDTHAEDGLVTENTPNKFRDQYSNVLLGSARAVSEFVSWCKSQEFYKDTVIVIVGDHLTMDADYPSRLSNPQKRSVFNVIINSDRVARNDKNRVATSFDIFPTVLYSLGFEWNGDRLGLGVNLYSGEKTIAEMMGLDQLNEAIYYKSTYYWKNIQKEK